MGGRMKLGSDYTYAELSESTKKRILVYAEHPEYMATPTGRSFLEALRITHPRAWDEIARLLKGGKPDEMPHL